MAAIAAALLGLYLSRAPILRQVGGSLVYSDPVATADVIVITLDSGGAGALEAADLVASGMSSRVAVFSDPPSGIDDSEFIRRGLPYDDRSARQVNQLALLGVRDVLRIPAVVSGTTDEVDAIPGWCLERGFRSVTVVTTSDHSRRTHRALVRSMNGLALELSVRASRYSNHDPDHWWKDRNGVRVVLVEFQKLLLDVVAHPTQ